MFVSIYFWLPHSMAPQLRNATNWIRSGNGEFIERGIFTAATHIGSGHHFELWMMLNQGGGTRALEYARRKGVFNKVFVTAAQHANVCTLQNTFITHNYQHTLNYSTTNCTQNRETRAAATAQQSSLSWSLRANPISVCMYMAAQLRRLTKQQFELNQFMREL